MKKRIGAIGTPPSSPEPSWLAHIWGKFRHFARANDGVSAIEFALLAPVLIPALLATADVGFALSERMTIDHVLRAGAQSAAAGGNAAAIDQVMRATAGKNFTMATPGAAGDDSSLALTVRHVCACAEQPGTYVTCSTTCAGSAPTQIFYELSGEKSYSGTILPRFSLSSALQVQVR